MTAATATRSARTATVRTPGVVATPADDGRGETDADAVAADAAPLDDGAAAETGDPKLVTLTQQQLDAAVARGVAQALAAHRRAEATPGKPEVPLPDQSEIDPAKIERPTLSRQGYVVPRNYGEPADPSVKR